VNFVAQLSIFCWRRGFGGLEGALDNVFEKRNESTDPSRLDPVKNWDIGFL
jgi:hypothetical protein